MKSSILLNVSCWKPVAFISLRNKLPDGGFLPLGHKPAAMPCKARARRYLCPGCPRLLFHQFSTLNTESHVEIVQLRKRCVMQKIMHEV